MTIECSVVTADGVTDRGCRLEDLGRDHGADGFVWVHLRDPGATELRQLQELVGAHELAIEDAIDAGQRPKVERYGDDQTFVVLKPATYRSGAPALDLTELHLLISSEHVITVAHGDDRVVAEVRRSNAELRTPASVFHAVADRVVDGYVAALEAVETDVQAIERRVFSAGEVRDLAPDIYDLKREVLELWHTTEPLVDPLQAVVAALAERGDPMAPYFRDVVDHLRLVVARSERMRDLLTDALDANIARLSVRQNEDMRKMSAWGALFLLPTVLVGVWGMNFEHMPELDEPWGYPFALAVIAGSCWLLWSRLRRAGWL